jgi:lipid II:glycine glycyltransferase (peptidoglycan interpeptide bridge formation enzyme)
MQETELHPVQGPGDGVTAGYTVSVSHAVDDRAWDDFVATVPSGDYVQTSLWAQVKAVAGWRAARVTIRRDGAIIAGAQLLIRPLPHFGAIGYVPRGPLLAGEDPELMGLVIDALHREARSQHLPYLVVQPPRNGTALVPYLLASGFGPSPIQAATTVTSRIDLSYSLDHIWAQMHKQTRRNIRRGLRRGVTVREGTENDLAVFHQLHVAASERHRLPPYPMENLRQLWAAFAPYGYVRLFLAEYEGDAVAAHLTIPFGDTLLSKRSGWSGRHGSPKPNETLEWGVIQWAKSRGYHYYDLDGLDPRAARCAGDSKRLPDSLKQTWTSYKLGFGGDVVVFPRAYDYVYNPLVRPVYRAVFPRIAGVPPVKSLVARLQ